jgi:hypothetical protein
MLFLSRLALILAIGLLSTSTQAKTKDAPKGATLEVGKDTPELVKLPVGDYCDDGLAWWFNALCEATQGDCDGYFALGYTLDGLVTIVDGVNRYNDGLGYDYDWNFYLRAVDDATCKQSTQLFGRKCAEQQERFVDIFWYSATDTWRRKELYKMYRAGIHRHLSKQDNGRFKLTLNQLNVAYDKNKKRAKREKKMRKARREVVPSEELLMETFYQLAPADHAGDARKLGKAMWLHYMKNPEKWKNRKSHPYKSTVTAEVQISRLNQAWEDDYHSEMLQLANLSNCDSAGAGNLCNQPMLVYGTAVADTNHARGKPELHPIRALVTTSALKTVRTKKGKQIKYPISSEGPTTTYRVRVFSDYGKAGDGGSGSSRGRICEFWEDNQYGTDGKGKPAPYVSIAPKSFVPPTRGKGKTRYCLVEPLHNKMADKHRKNGLKDFPSSQRTQQCSNFDVDTYYRPQRRELAVDKITWRESGGTQYGGYGVADVTVGYADGPLYKTPFNVSYRSLGIKKNGQWLGKKSKLKAKHNAHYYKVTAKTAIAKIDPKNPPTLIQLNSKLKSIKWNVLKRHGIRRGYPLKNVQWSKDAKTSKGTFPTIPKKLSRGRGKRDHWRHDHQSAKKPKWGSLGKCDDWSYAVGFL